jgi:hypothetical protein
VRRGVPIPQMVVEDAGGRFFFWNTVLFLSILLLAFALLLSDRLTRQGTAAKMMAGWLIVAIVFYHNNISPRPAHIDYASQLDRQCEVGASEHQRIEVLSGPSWSFYLAKPQLDKLCTGSVH